MPKWIEQLKQTKTYAHLLQLYRSIMALGNNTEQSSQASKESLNATMRKKQAMWGAIVLGGLLVLALILHGLAANPKSKKSNTHTPVSQAAQLPDGVLSQDFTEKESLSALEAQQLQINHLNDHLKSLSKLADQIAKEKEVKAKQKAQANKKLDFAKQEQMRQTPLKNTLPKVANAHIPSPFATHSASETPKPMATLQFHYAKPVAYSPKAFYPKTYTTPSHKKSVKNYVPAGTFVKGVLLEGADANASVNGQSDTVPILVRLIDHGTLPNGGRSHLKGCFVLASIYGDISSERGEARLDTVSCTRKDGSVFEAKVQGHLSFAGKEGIKGRPIMRNGKILTMAGISGALSGFGSALQQSTQTISTSSLGSVATVQGDKIFKSGAYGGASTAMGQLAHYYIQRANQYHPIISIGSGTLATVIFQKGFSLVDKSSQRAQSADHHDEANEKELAEVKQLLLKTKAMSDKSNQATPFSNLSGLKLGQTFSSEG